MSLRQTLDVSAPVCRLAAIAAMAAEQRGLEETPFTIGLHEEGAKNGQLVVLPLDHRSPGIVAVHFSGRQNSAKGRL
jgi:hypothetical protein